MATCQGKHASTIFLHVSYDGGNYGLTCERQATQSATQPKRRMGHNRPGPMRVRHSHPALMQGMRRRPAEAPGSRVVGFSVFRSLIWNPSLICSAASTLLPLLPPISPRKWIHLAQFGTVAWVGKGRPRGRRLLSRLFGSVCGAGKLVVRADCSGVNAGDFFVRVETQG